MTSNATQTSDRRGETPGAALRAARLAQNLGVADVARQLKLSINQVEALEAGDFERLPGPVFVRGFTRNYARLLRLDAEALLRQVEAGLPREEPRPAAPPSQDIPFPATPPRRWRVYALAAAAVVAALAAYEFSPTTTSEPPSKEPVVAAPASEPAAPPAAGTGGASAPEAMAGPSAAGASNEAKAEARVRPGTVQPGPQAGTGAADGAQSAAQLAAGAPAAQNPPPAAAKSAAREEEATPGPGERQVHLVFAQASWVEIRDRSGKAIFSQLNPPGTEQRVNGRPPLAVVVGNAHGVKLTYDERPVNLSVHTKVDVARLTLQ